VNKNSKYIIVTMVFMLLLTFEIPVSLAKSKSTKLPVVKDVNSCFGFVGDTPQETVLNNGLVINIDSIRYVKDRIYSSDGVKDASGYFAFRESKMLSSNKWIIEVIGFNISIKNTSNKVRIIRWCESAISVGEFSGVPFLDGMKYADANTLNTPDNIFAPGQTISRTVYLPRINYRNEIIGRWIPLDEPLKFNLVLKVYNETNVGSYHIVNIPPIGVFLEQIESSKKS